MQTISREELEAMNGSEKRDFVLINVLPREDFRHEHIRTSINIPKASEDFSDEVERVAGSKEREVVLYCANFDCPLSAEAARELDEKGFNHVYDYEGGSADWLKHHH
ncbi:MAG: sulfurtransferase [Porticoccus sp.]|uniref:rhodanese-like domain-containing protein n=1 Tax=Porticoccus hydrocarbonoclasticus TaxID=1073414 RepID=UPI000C6C12D7|nr:rhodanese-like domain-containing protein [Porticoccus hydrocarbonoclasticus]MBG56832.1 sulfurtransferase [Porticoccus sp.]|tara:strand:+ start:22813 stop:23133 length:321 start_codon:yes stop_codon:yes gene_type:complete